VLRRIFDHLIDTKVLFPSGKFSDPEFDKTVFSLDSKLSLRSRAYHFLFKKSVTVQVVHEFIVRLKKWRVSPLF